MHILIALGNNIAIMNIMEFMVEAFSFWLTYFINLRSLVRKTPPHHPMTSFLCENNTCFVFIHFNALFQGLSSGNTDKLFL